jgi:hypothetical protein
MLGTFPTACALYRIYITGVAGQSDFEIPRSPINTLHFAVGDDIDVQVPADLDQFR